MSTRTRRSRSQVPGVVSVHKPNRSERRQEHARVRHETHMALATVAEPEDLALPRPHHTAVRLEPVNRDEVAEAPERRKFRVWKTKAWKRRKLERRQRALMEYQLLRQA
jgi:hypothetical protein